MPRLLDRLISDIYAVTETVMNCDEIDLAVWQRFQDKTSPGKTEGSTNSQSNHHYKDKMPMSKGADRTVVCEMMLRSSSAPAVCSVAVICMV